MQKGFAGLFIIVGLLITAAIGGGAYYLYNQQQLKQINSFDECAKKYPVMESYPAQCRTPDGRHFVQNLSEDEKRKLVPPTQPESDLSCINSKSDEYKNAKYVEGELLVSFTVMAREAEALIKAKGLASEEVGHPIDPLPPVLMLVKVPEGEEFEWICYLEKEEVIRYAEPNFIYKISN